jgi:hypothetical protein
VACAAAGLHVGRMSSVRPARRAACRKCHTPAADRRARGYFRGRRSPRLSASMWVLQMSETSEYEEVDRLGYILIQPRCAQAAREPRIPIMEYAVTIAQMVAHTTRLLLVLVVLREVLPTA